MRQHGGASTGTNGAQVKVSAFGVEARSQSGDAGGSNTLEMLAQALGAYEAEVSDLRRVIAEQTHQIAESRAAVAERDAMVASTSWQLTRPLRALVGVLKGDRNYRAQLGKLLTRRRARMGSARPSDARVSAWGRQQATRTPELLPLPTYPEPGPDGRRRITLVVDAVHTLESDATARIAALAAVMLARRRGWALRVVTREADVDPDALSALLRRHRISHRDDVAFDASPPVPFAPPIGVTSSDYFIAPADGGAWSVVDSVDPSHVCIVLDAGASARLMPGPDRQRLAALMRLPGPRIVVADAQMPVAVYMEDIDPTSGIPLSLDFAATEEDVDWAALLAPALDCLNWP
jgi:hypothetical protein